MTRQKRKTTLANASALDRLALAITERVGTMTFFVIIFIWTISWLLWNMFAPRHMRFDPFPGFVLWLFFSNMIQLFLMPLIMIGQNLQGREADQRAENDYQVNCKAEIEIRQTKARLIAIMDHLHIELPHDTDTDPDTEDQKIAAKAPTDGDIRRAPSSGKGSAR